MMNDVNMHLQFSIRKRENLKKKRCKTCEMRQGQHRLCCDRSFFTSFFFFAIFLNVVSTSNHKHEICVLINASADSRVVIDELVLGDLKKDDTILK